jgi:hypothetical protein
MTSTQKADAYRKAYVNSVRNQPLCLGSYAFTWGNKQEATSTWYGMLLPDGSKLAAVDALRDLWTGHPGTPNAPVIASFDVDADRVKPGALVHATLSVSDPQNDPLRVEYLLTADKERISPGGQVEPPQEGFENAVVSSSQTGADVRMPTDPGPYRLFVYIHDKHNESAVANIALDVTEKKTIVSDAPKADMPYDIYSNGQSSADYIPSGYMGNRDAIHMDAHCQTVQGHSGSECLQVRYTASDGWGGVVWQSPSNDWGDQDGGLNLTGAKKLLFWARGDRGGEKVTFDFGLIGDDKKYSDSDSGKLADVVLTQDWKQYSIDLADKDLSRIKTGFCWIVAGSGKPTTFYLDDIRYDGPSQAPAGGQAGSALSAHSDARKANLPYALYANGESAQDYVASGYMGNTGAVQMDMNSTAVGGHSGSQCIQVKYAAADNWAGVVWQSPANDWGDRRGGLDLTGARVLTFWARGDQGGETATFEYGLIGHDKKYPDSSSGKLADVKLSTIWKKYSISLANKDLSRIKTGFCWIVAGAGKPVTFYIDDITYE